MAITLTYDTPVTGQDRLSGTVTFDTGTGEFSCPIIYNAGTMDLSETEARMTLHVQESTDPETTP